MHYLDDLCLYSNPTSTDIRNEARTKVQDRFQHSDLSGSLDDAFNIWDAVSSSVEKLIHTKFRYSFTKVSRRPGTR